MRVQFALIWAAVLVAGLNARAARAAEWRYCLAIAPSQHAVYMSAPFPNDTPMETLEAAFAHALDRARVEHDAVQCPRGSQESIATMRLQAMQYNRASGNKIVEFDWQP